jgi:ArsR family metal-binding transcriptional regulator
MDSLTTFADPRGFERAAAVLDRLGILYSVISPAPAYDRVGCPAITLTVAAKARFIDGGGSEVVNAGWVDLRAPACPVPDQPSPEFAEDVVGRVAIVVLATCIADSDRLRLIAHFAGDVAEALPYLNAQMNHASYVATLPVLTFMDGHRMVSLFRDRVGIAKADDIVDAWATLERVRCLANDVWSRRADIEPSCELRRRPPALEIYKRLPGTNCGQCGQATCLAFAWAVWRSDAEPRLCLPVFAGEHGGLKDALLSICAGLGLAEPSDGATRDSIHVPQRLSYLPENRPRDRRRP